MKKTIIVLQTIILLFVFTGCFEKEKQTDGQRFKKEYEALNNQKNSEGKAYSEIEMPESERIVYTDKEKLLEVLENGTHIVYMGWPSCNWCRRSLPVLLDTVENYSGIYIYYYSLLEDRTQYEESGDGFYKEVVETLENSDFDFSEYISYYEDGTMKLPSSLILFIKDGEIIGAHIRTVESHLSGYDPLDSQQTEELSEIYSWYLQKMIEKTPVGCSDKCD